jgi:hypothetical protein
LLCKKTVAFLLFISRTKETGVTKLGVSEELLPPITGIAHYLKLLLRICLQALLRLEEEKSASEGLSQFLDLLSTEDRGPSLLEQPEEILSLADQGSDLCTSCQRPIDDHCVRSREKRWHDTCLICSVCGKDLGDRPEHARLGAFDRFVLCDGCGALKARDPVEGFIRVTKLEQYAFLLSVALARLIQVVRDRGVLASPSGPVEGPTLARPADKFLEPGQSSDHQSMLESQTSTPDQDIGGRSVQNVRTSYLVYPA